MATDIGPVVAEAPETRQRYRRLRALNVFVGVLLAAEAAFMLLEALRLPIHTIDPWLDLEPTPLLKVTNTSPGATIVFIDDLSLRCGG